MRCMFIVSFCAVLVGCGGEDSNPTTPIAVSAPENDPKPSVPEPAVDPPVTEDEQEDAKPQSQELSDSQADPAQVPAATANVKADLFPAPIDTSGNPPAAPFGGEEQGSDVVIPDEIQRLGDPYAESFDEYLKQMVAYPSAVIRKRLVEKVNARSVDRSPGYGEKGIHALRGALLDPSVDVRLAATNIVSTWASYEGSKPFAAQAIPELALNLDHENQGLVMSSVGTLGVFGADASPALAHLRWRLRKSKDDGSMVSTLCRVFRRMGPAAAGAVPELEAIAFSRSANNDAAWDAIGKIGDQAVIRRGLESNDFSVKLQSSGAAIFLNELEPETAVALRLLLKDDKSMIRGHAAKAVGKTKPMTEELATEIAALLKDESNWARFHAAQGLAVIEPQFDVARQALMAGLDDEADDVTKACREALANYSGTGKTLLQVTFDKARGAQKLDIDNNAVLPVFDDYFVVLEDTQADVFDRVCAYLSLSQVSWDSKATKEQKQKVEDYRKKLLDVSVPFQLRIAALKNFDELARDSRDLTREQLVKGINGCVLRTLRLRCLGNCSDQAIEAAIPEIIKVLASEKEADQKIHYSAISTLHKYGKLANQATPHLVNLLDSSATRSSALTALGDIGASPELAIPAINSVISEGDLSISTALLALAKIHRAHDMDLTKVAEETKKYWDEGKFQPEGRIKAMTLALGDSAGPIVPNVIGLFDTDFYPPNVINSLGNIGPPAKAAGPKLISMIKPEDRFPYDIIQALRKIGLDGSEFAKVAEAQLANTENRGPMLRELYEFGPGASEAVPSIMKYLDDDDSQTRSAAINAIGAMGEAGRAANKQLQAIADGEDSRFARYAATSLIRLYPENERVLAFCLSKIGYMRDYEATSLKQQLGDNYAILVKVAKASDNEDIQQIAETLDSVE